MGLFGRKEACPICGGTVKGLLPTKVEGQALCKECSKSIDLPDGALYNMTLADYRDYLVFRQQNEYLRSQFNPTQDVNLGFFNDSYHFDIPNRLMCRNDSSWVTIFEGREIKTFVIREDDCILYEGSAEGLKCYTSSVPQLVDDLRPMINQARMYQRMDQAAERRGEETPYYDIEVPIPFEKFFIEIHFDHPYWPVMTSEKNGPTFGSTPSANDYLQEYNEQVATMELLARGLMAVAFPDAPELQVDPGMEYPVVDRGTATSAESMDIVDEIQRYKALLDQGILTEEEFTAKKRQLLGI